MPFGPYKLKNPGAKSSIGKAQKRFQRLCGPVTVVKKADPEKLKEWRKKQKEENKFKERYE